MFQFPSFPPRIYVFNTRYPGIPLGGFPHSDISGSKLADSSPKLFAVYHVLHRLLAPRHPPCALSSLITTCLLASFAGSFFRSHSIQFLRCQFLALPASDQASLATGSFTNCQFYGDEGTRTPDLLRAREALSHLSYIPYSLWAFLDLNQRPYPYQRNALAD